MSPIEGVTKDSDWADAWAGQQRDARRTYLLGVTQEHHALDFQVVHLPEILPYQEERRREQALTSSPSVSSGVGLSPFQTVSSQPTLVKRAVLLIGFYVVQM